MNLTEKILSQKEKSTFYIWSSDINYYSCSIIVLIGLISNLFTIVAINSKCRNTSKSVESIRVNFQYHPGYRTSQKYILAMAISDTLFLLSHLIEDIFPQVSLHPFYQIVNNYDFVCKLTLYVRNGSRMCSSYLVVLYAWERYVVIKAPLKRLRFHKNNITRSVILSVFLFSYTANLYTPFISGIRLVEIHNTDNYNQSELLTNEYECDTKKEFLTSYDYIGLAYINTGILVPILFLIYFNISIVYVLFTRKNVKFRRQFSLNSEAKSKFSIYKSNNSLAKTQFSSQSVICKSTSIYLFKKPMTDYSIEMKQINKPTKSSSCLDEKSTNKHSNSLPLPTKQLNQIKKNLKDSDRATLILIVLSALFILFNLPYIISWLFFYIPYIREELNIEQIYFRFSLLSLVEIFHILNFSIGFFLYFSVSKLFRKDILDKFKCFNSFKKNTNIFY